ncbi:hypothetical protein A1Q2_04013 [Trichosporon asahii var. asahii CBS 8904]|uniref:Uncharacterized protein n=1 Tax=Trichosporon asahii var. asahii (strain CBS 8904) TaxID=1220162 RepID=K1VQJ3_TRIAC|nr:hypothetical protein A1Q2_04013 [Trichosporon asahii var. asahii CBS 8904]
MAPAPSTQKSARVSPQKEQPKGHFAAKQVLTETDKYTYWRRSILLGIILSAYLGYTKGGAYGWVPALVTFYSTVHIFESIAKKPEGIFARLFLVVTNLQRIIDFEDFVLSPFRSQVKAA